ncbi:MAG: RNA methyltransferase [Ferruginibacter sp.]
MSEQLPAALLASLQTAKGFDENAFVQTHQSGEQIVSIRVNRQKGSMENFFSPNEKVPWCTDGYYLPSRPSFTLDPLFHAGMYYVQEASSMFLEQLLRQSCDLTRPLRVLDLCAAPGGKSTLIQSTISTESLLVSNEVIKARVNILADNMTKWGGCNVVVTNNDPSNFQQLPGYFDVIVVDAPCSGSGLFRKDPGAIKEWSLNNVELCSQRQERILADILPSLKPGGVLIYSTCSYSEKEDEHICDWLVKAQQLAGLRFDVKPEWNIVESVSPKQHAYGYRFYPDKLQGEGFFIAGFRKMPDEAIRQSSKHSSKQASPQFITAAEMTVIRPYFENPGDVSFIKWKNEILAFPGILLNDIGVLQSSLYIKKAGVKIGKIIRDELIPDHEFAMSRLLSNNIPAVEVDTESALEYLRRKELKVDTELKGWALLKYNGSILGWIKILPNRVNNYYPKALRILNK